MKAATAALLFLAACGGSVATSSSTATDDAGVDAGSDAAVALPAYVRPRVAGIDTLSNHYDADGYPIVIGNRKLTWENGRLVKIVGASQGNTDSIATFTYADERIQQISETNVWSDDDTPLQNVTTIVGYQSNGALSTVRQVSREADIPANRPATSDRVTTYGYDASDRLNRISHGTPSHPTSTVYRTTYEGQCPSSTSNIDGPTSYTYENGRLASYTGIVNTTFRVTYDDKNRIFHMGFGSQPQYYSGEGRGIEVFALYNKTQAGFFGLAGIFRSDGTCDPTLTSPEMVLAVLLSDFL